MSTECPRNRLPKRVHQVGWIKCAFTACPISYKCRRWQQLNTSQNLPNIVKYSKPLTNVCIFLQIVTVPHKMVGLERMSDYRGSTVYIHIKYYSSTTYVGMKPKQNGRLLTRSQVEAMAMVT